MSIKIKSEKELNKIIKMLKENTNIIKEAYNIFYDDQLEETEDINICNVEKVINHDNTINYFLGINFQANNKSVIIEDSCINYNTKTKEIILNTDYAAFINIIVEE